MSKADFLKTFSSRSEWLSGQGKQLLAHYAERKKAQERYKAGKRGASLTAGMQEIENIEDFIASLADDNLNGWQEYVLEEEPVQEPQVCCMVSRFLILFSSLREDR